MQTSVSVAPSLTVARLAPRPTGSRGQLVLDHPVLPVPNRAATQALSTPRRLPSTPPR